MTLGPPSPALFASQVIRAAVSYANGRAAIPPSHHHRRIGPTLRGLCPASQPAAGSGPARDGLDRPGQALSAGSPAWWARNVFRNVSATPATVLAYQRPSPSARPAAAI